MTPPKIPVFTGAPKKNDALFMYGATQPGPFVFVYEQEQTEIVGGPSCNADKELFLDNCANDSVPLHHRRTGGGTVVLSFGMIIIIVVGERCEKDPAHVYFNLVHNGLISALSAAGIDGVEKVGISDLAINGRKILGSSMYRGTSPCRYYYQSSLLVAPDISLFARYLRHPPREPDYRKMRPHTDFCTTLEREGFLASPFTIKHCLQKSLREAIVGYSVDIRPEKHP